jgi:hypothetical protein
MTFGCLPLQVCQQSISIDAILSSAAGILYMLFRAGHEEGARARARALGCSLASVLVGPAAGLALFCAIHEERLQSARHGDGLQVRKRV